MSAYEIMDLIASQLSIINEVWNFFLTIHMAIIGLLIIARQFVPGTMKVVIIIAYLGFLGVNYSAQADNYSQLEALYADAAMFAEREEMATGAQASGEVIRNYDLTEKARLLPLVYSFTATLTILCLFFINSIQGRKRGDRAGGGGAELL